MEHIPQSKAEKFEMNNVTSWEYTTQSESMNLALIRVNGRYPTTGYTLNREADSLIQITAGAGTLGMSDGTITELAMYDQIHIQKGDAYFFEGELEMVYTATPKWTPEQTEQVE